jgi:hypothetical protein
MVPAQVLSAAVTVFSDGLPKFQHFFDKLSAIHLLQVFVHGWYSGAFNFRISQLRYNWRDFMYNGLPLPVFRPYLWYGSGDLSTFIS